MSHPLDTDALYNCECGQWHFKWETTCPNLPYHPVPLLEALTEANRTADYCREMLLAEHMAELWCKIRRPAGDGPEAPWTQAIERVAWERLEQLEKKILSGISAAMPPLTSATNAKKPASCQHPSATRTARANTGNYDPSADCYWYEFRCPDCGKFWTEDQ